MKRLCLYFYIFIYSFLLIFFHQSNCFSEPFWSLSEKRYYFNSYDEMTKFFAHGTTNGITFSEKPTPFYTDVRHSKTEYEAVTTCIHHDQEANKVLFTVYQATNHNQELPDITIHTGEHTIIPPSSPNPIFWKICSSDGRQQTSQNYVNANMHNRQIQYDRRNFGHLSTSFRRRSDGRTDVKFSFGNKERNNTFASNSRLVTDWSEVAREYRKNLQPITIYDILDSAKYDHFKWMEWCIKRLDGEHPLFVSRVNEILSLNPPDGIDDYYAIQSYLSALEECRRTNNFNDVYLSDNGRLSMARFKLFRDTLLNLSGAISGLTKKINNLYWWDIKSWLRGVKKKDLMKFADWYCKKVDEIAEHVYKAYPVCRTWGHTSLATSHPIAHHLNLSQSKELLETANKWTEEYEQAVINEDEQRVMRYENRHKALEQATRPDAQPYFYGNQIKLCEPFNDPADEIFRTCFGSALDHQLHQELCDIRSELKLLQEQSSHNTGRVELLTPIVTSITRQAKEKTSVEEAFTLSDCAWNIIDIIWAKGIDLLQAAPEVLTQGATALVKGAVKGVATTLDPHHWAEMLNPQTWIEAAKGVATLAGSVSNLIAAEEAQGAAFLASAITGNDELYWQKHQEFIAACDEFAGGALQQLQAMSWEELLQGGAELATTFVLDGFVMKAVTLYSTKAGKALIKNLAEAIKADSAPERMIELAGVGKIALEEGAEEVITLLKSTPEAESNAAIIRTINSEKLKVPLSTLSTEMTNVCEWSMPEGGKMINGRWYTQHALERMAPKNPEVRGVLSSRAIKKGFPFGSEKHFDYTNSRGIPPSVVEDVIQNGIKSIGSTQGTIEIIKDHIKVVVSEKNGAVVTVHPY